MAGKRVVVAYAPITIFAYNRREHLRKTVESLRLNSGAPESDLYVFSDAPRDASAADKVEKVRAYAKSIRGFASVTVIEREHNFGLAHSIIAGVTEVLGTHPRVIVLEDDLVTSPYFLQYMNDALDRYEACEKVVSIHGYCYPVGRSLPETFFLNDPGCLGWATWKRGWALFNPNGADLLAQLRARGLSRSFDYDGAYPYTKMLVDQVAGEVGSWAIRWYASVFLAERLVLHPGRTLVKHIGYDGSGTNCGSIDRPQDEVSDRPIAIKDVPVLLNDEVRAAYVDYLWWHKYPVLQAMWNRLMPRKR